ncbi:probable aspartyl protease At4g16563 [Syzygium oleosum]|uniref:probable aspartyl protease At4g16563 n=1 Tax=Syzygium oleosum TaxID=219896 RepID=UPI0011D27E86|nr:probable aspartyl protease At4g16563 [Syzygium oleosum]
MASSLLVSVIAFLCFVSVSLSETLLLPLTHSLSHAGSQFNSTHHLLRATSARSAARFRRHRRLPQQASLPLSPGSDYTLSLTVHSQPVSLYMDTGSDLVWVPCSPFTCILCDGKPKPTPVAVNSSSTSDVPCKASACRAVHSPLSSSSDLCAMARCPLEDIEISDCAAFSCPQFYYAYGDGSLVGRLKKGVVTIPTSSPPLVLQNFTFGCAHTALAEPVGVAGFGRGPLSLPAQLAASSPQLGAQFSYCLVSHSFDADRVRRPSPLILGRYDVKEKSSEGKGGSDFAYTPMLDSPNSPYFYSVGLEGISVGKRFIPAPENLRRIDGKGDGGVVVDSGTTFTILPSGLFSSVAAEFDRQLGRVNSRRAREVEDRTGLSLCYYVDAGVRVADVAFRFGGGSGVAMPRGNYFYEFVDGGDKGRRVGCLMMMDGGDATEMGGGPGATLGNYQQQGFEVVYDLEGRRVGFARRQCASMWDSLRQG